MIVQLMQAKAYLKSKGEYISSSPEPDDTIETAIQLRMLVEKQYALLEEAHRKGMGYLLPVAFRMLHSARMTNAHPPTFIDLIDELAGQEIIDFEHPGKLFFGDEPEPDIDEPVEDDDDDVPF